MIKKALFMALALVALLPAKAFCQDEAPEQERRYTMYGVMFYNLENLFDTINNNGNYDKEFSPLGARQWNGTKYWQKQHNMAYAISQMKTAQHGLCHQPDGGEGLACRGSRHHRRE